MDVHKKSLAVMMVLKVERLRKITEQAERYSYLHNVCCDSWLVTVWKQKQYTVSGTRLEIG